MRALWGALVVSAAFLAACAPAPPAPRLGGLAPSGIVPGGVPVTTPHTLSAGDVFEIRFPFAAQYNGELTVGMDGTVAPQAIGSVEVGGLTVPEARAELQKRYAGVLRDPELSITMRRFAPEVIYVDGWVRKPGLVRSDIPLTVNRAITQAGGVKYGAKTGDVLIMRHGADGRVRTYSVKLAPYAGAGAQDPLLKSFDVVYVPQTAIAAIADFARQYYGSVPFAASFHIPPTRAPSVIVPQVTAPRPSPPPVVTPQ